MKAPPLLRSRPEPVRFVLAAVVPAVFGAVGGVVLGVNEAAYVVLSLLAILGGVAAGFEHEGARDGAQRGAAGGLLFGAGILLASAATGDEPKADLPDPEGLLLVVTTVLSTLFGAIGGALRGRHAAAAG